MYRTNFQKNWNNKLFQDNFGTVRLPDAERYFIGSEHEIYLNDVKLGEAKIYAIRNFKFADIRDALAYLDAGMPAAKLAAMLKTMYSKKLESGLQNDTILTHLIFHWKRREMKAFEQLAANWWQEISDTFYSPQQEFLAI